jgi:hypothetical protein
LAKKDVKSRSSTKQEETLVKRRSFSANAQNFPALPILRISAANFSSRAQSNLQEVSQWQPEDLVHGASTVKARAKRSPAQCAEEKVARYAPAKLAKAAA